MTRSSPSVSEQVRALLRVLYRLLSSRHLAVATLVSWIAIVVVWVVPFQLYGLADEQVLAIVTREAFSRVIYAVLLANTAVCIAPRIVRAVRRATFSPAPGSTPARAGRGESLPGPFDASRAVAALREAGFRRVVRGDAWAWGVRRRWSVLGTVAFHASFLVVAVAVVLHLDPATTFRGTATVAEGERFTGEAASYVDSPEGWEESRYPAAEFELVELTPEFHRDLLLFTRLDGLLRTGSAKTREIAVGHPVYLWPGTTVSLVDFGYAPVVQETTDEGGQTSTNVYKLQVFPSGSEDSYVTQVGSLEYRVSMAVWGDYVDRDGEPGSASFNLTDPRASVSIRRILLTGVEREYARDELVGLGEPVEVPGATFVVRDVSYYGVFRIVSSPAVPVMVVGLLLACAGVVARLLFPREDVLVSEAADGARVSVVRDAYKAAPGATERVRDAWERLR